MDQKINLTERHYDIVGDIHGYAGRFKVLLEALGYQEIDGVWQHPTRILVSVGDIIDRGPEQKETVNILMAMQQHNKAIVLMGNHEFYAITWNMRDQNGHALRPHTAKNYQEHKAFLEQVGSDLDWYNKAIAWFKTLPIFVILPGFRCVHAAWHEQHIQTLAQYTTQQGVITEQTWQNLKELDVTFYRALEYTLNGSKVNLPEGYSFIDSGGKKRSKARLKWWDVPNKGATYRNACTSVPDLSALPDTPLNLKNKPQLGSSKPIFFGHYWMQGTPRLNTSYATCLDWSVVVDDGVLAAYRFDGEQVLDESKLVWV